MPERTLGDLGRHEPNRPHVYIETQLAPTLKPGDVVVLDNLSVHKSARAEAAIRARGAWLLFLPQYSPDVNPIEMAFSKLKAHLRRAAARTYDALFSALADICALFEPHECRNYFKAAGYAPEYRHDALDKRNHGHRCTGNRRSSQCERVRFLGKEAKRGWRPCYESLG